MRQEKYDRLKKMYDSKHFEDVCADAIEAVNAEKKISDHSKKIVETQQRLIDIIGGFESDANSVLENLMDLYNQRECKLLEAVYILGACDAETYL